MLALWNRAISRMRNVPLPLVAVLGMLALVPPFSAVPAAEVSQAGPSPQAVGVPPGPPPQLTVLFTGEVAGWTEPCG